MPVKNTVKHYAIPAYYHVYNRGAGEQDIFRDDQDRNVFLSIVARHIDPFDSNKRRDGSEYPKYDIALNAYCLMDNHFHMLVFLDSDPTALTRLMRSVCTAYTMYFNKKYKQSGHLFQSVFKASRITDESYLMHITRYIHMNPRHYLRYKWSSLGLYLGEDTSSWLKYEMVGEMKPIEYREFLQSYEGKKAELKLIKSQLAN